MARINRKERAEELFETDRPFIEQGFVVAGMDEVGRGPLAGNVVVACVVMPTEPLLEWVDDSKKLSESRREKVYDEILSIARYVGIGQVSPAEIDEINILEATRKAMLEAAEDKTVIFISHRLSTTVNADKIYVMEQGRIIESGPHKELMSKNGTYAEMFNLQAEKYVDKEN